MLINLSELFTCEGKKKVYNAEIGLTEVSMGRETYRIVSKSPFDLTVTNTGARKYFLEGSTEVTVEIPCSRCLEPVAYVCELTLDRELETDKPEAGQAGDLDEQPYLNGYNLDVDKGKTIVVFDWNGLHVRTYQLQNACSAISYDAADNTIYALSQEGNKPQIITLNL